MKKYDIIVIGAGMSGLAAASEIYKSNQNIMVLEGRDRIGGRLSSERLDDGLLFERGGELIHGTKNPMYDLVNELGIKIREMKKEPMNISTMDGIQLFVVMMFLRLGLYPKPTVNESVSEYLDRLQFLPQALRDVADKSSKDFETLDRISAMSIINRLREEMMIGESYGEHDFVIEDGYITILSHLAKELPIAFNHKVDKINWNDEHVVIETNHGTFQAKQVILTLPIPILKKMNFEPALPNQKQDALSAHVSGDIIKLIIPVHKKAFKTEHEEGGIEGATQVPMWWRRNLPQDQPDDRQILVGWITGPYARRFLSQSTEDAIDLALSELSAIVDIEQINRDDIIAQNWMDDEFSTGTYCYIKPGYGLNVVNDLSQSLSNKLYFAGTATARAAANGTAHGAYESGLRVAKEVLA